jgi:Meiotically up-regulated gene 113
VKNKIYFAAAGGRVKIGTTTKKVTERITSINSHLAKPLQVIGFIDGGHPLEHAIHKYCARWRIRGEWFHDCPEIRKEIDRIIAVGPRAIGFTGEIVLYSERSKGRLPAGKPQSIGIMARLIWGERALVQLMAFTGYDPAVITSWLDGSVDCPRLVRYAFSAVVLQYISENGPPSFIEGDDAAGAVR